MCTNARVRKHHKQVRATLPIRVRNTSWRASSSNDHTVRPFLTTPFASASTEGLLRLTTRSYTEWTWVERTGERL
eukprot:12491847-Alexandrium_andersonii.AAC.1